VLYLKQYSEEAKQIVVKHN